MFSKKIIKAIQRVSEVDNVKLEFPANISHGDYSTNVALVNRLDSEELAEKLRSDSELSEFIAKIEVKNRFINFWIKPEKLINSLDLDSRLHGNDNSRKIIIEYSSPNIAKSFSIGHFRSTVIGQAIYNLYKYLGNDVWGISHIGDWGTQFGMILAEIELTNTNINNVDIKKLEELYLNFNQKLSDNPELKENARNWFKKLEEKDADAREKWEKIKEISLAEFEKTYNKLQVQIDEVRGESFYEDKMQEVVDQAEESKISSVGEGGAVIVEFEKLPPAMLVKSDGTTTYFTRDLAALKYRVEVDKADLIVYEVGSEQTLHFKQVFETAKMFEWGKHVELVHVPHGLIRLKDGKMSTRKGNTIKLNELIEKAIEKAGSEIIGVGALKYNDLKRNPSGEIIFNWEEVLSMEGNSGPYLQYSVVRGKSVLQKSGEAGKYKSMRKIGETESILLRKLARFDEIIFTAAKTYSPSTLATYLYDLAGEFNRFYNEEQIIGSETEDFKLFLTSKFVEKLEAGLALLGIQVPEKM